MLKNSVVIEYKKIIKRATHIFKNMPSVFTAMVHNLKNYTVPL